jgi:5-formyltetrahydrofolate cyclo-ligase
MTSEVKHSIRKEILAKRDALSAEEIKELSEHIAKNLSVLEQYAKAKIVMFYASHKSEVHTDDMISEALKSKKVVLPKVENGEIIPLLILDMENLIPGLGGIREPLLAPSMKLSSIDAVVVPGIAFDETGHRIGTGKGFYDAFLKKLHAVKIGLAFECQLVESIPHEPHDVHLDFIVTENSIIDCKK